MKKNKVQNTRKGFTLIELTMVILLVGILAAIGAPLTIELADSFNFSLYRRDLSDSATAALTRMGREMRRLKNDTSVIIAEPSTYRFIDVNNKTIQFALTGTNLQRYDGINTDVLAANVTSFNFTYLDANLAAITPIFNQNATNIKFIQINIVFSSNNNTINYMTLIRLRNILEQSDLFS